MAGGGDFGFSTLPKIDSPLGDLPKKCLPHRKLAKMSVPHRRPAKKCPPQNLRPLAIKNEQSLKLMHVCKD